MCSQTMKWIPLLNNWFHSKDCVTSVHLEAPYEALFIHSPSMCSTEVENLSVLIFGSYYFV